MPRYKLTIAYDGTDFCGWQKQFPHADAVPSALTMPPSHEFDDDGPAPACIQPEGLAESSRGRSEVASSDRASPPVPGAGLSQPERLQELHDAPLVADPRSHETDDTPRVELRTIQSVVERAVRHVVREPVQVVGASRTDAGVHARGQVAAFTCSDTGGREGGWPESRGLESLARAINSRLPRDVLVTRADLVPPGFDPIRGAARKAYSYTLWTGPDRPLWERNRALHVWSALDVEAMHAAARVLEGEHDFAGFAAAGHGRKTTVRTVHLCGVRRVSPEIVVIEVVGNGFLWNMVRIIAGTLVEVGKNAMTLDRVREALAKADRRLAGPTAPAQGLCLEWIQYDRETRIA